MPEWLNATTASLGLSLAALFVSLLNRRTSVRALLLSEAQEQRRAPALVIRVDDHVAWNTAAGDRYVGVSVLLTNSSDRDGSVTRASLHVRHADGIVIQVPSSSGPLPPGPVSVALPMPCNLSGNSSASGWLIFHTQTASRGPLIDDYTLVVDDSRALVEHIPIWPLRELT